jgi:hypothetical protein
MGETTGLLGIGGRLGHHHLGSLFVFIFRVIFAQSTSPPFIQPCGGGDDGGGCG